MEIECALCGELLAPMHHAGGKNIHEIAHDCICILYSRMCDLIENADENDTAAYEQCRLISATIANLLPHSSY